MQAIFHAANIHDRDGGVVLMAGLFGLFPFSLNLHADDGSQGQKFQTGMKEAPSRVKVEFVKRSEQGKFVVLPKR